MATESMLTNALGTKFFYQWDKDQYLTVTGDATQVHFYMPGQEDAACMDVVAGKVLIPNELFLTPGQVLAWAYKTDHSIEKHAWTVEKRPAPSGFVYTPTQITTWAEIEEEMNTAVAAAQAARDAAAASAQSALESKNAAAATLANAVTKTGNQSIDGDLTITGDIVSLKGIEAADGFAATGYDAALIPNGFSGVVLFKSENGNRLVGLTKSAEGVITYDPVKIGASIDGVFSQVLNADGTVTFNFNISAPNLQKDDAPTEDSNNLVTSNGVYNAIGHTPDSLQYLRKRLGEYYVALQRGYHVNYVDGETTKIKDGTDTGVIALRLMSDALTLSDLPAGTKIKCGGISTARVWFATSDDVQVGYTEFVSEYVIPETYNGTAFEKMFIDVKNSDGSVSEIDYAYTNIRFYFDNIKSYWSMHKTFSDFKKDNAGTITTPTLDSDGSLLVSNGVKVYRNAVIDALFERCTWMFKINTIGSFAFGTRDANGDNCGYRCLVDPSAKTFQIQHSDWGGTDSVKRNLTFSFDMLYGEYYIAEIIKVGTYQTTFRLSCMTDQTKVFEYVHTAVDTQLTNKIRGWGGIAFEAIGSSMFRMYEMAQKYSVSDTFDLLLIGDSYVECGTTLLESNKAFAYLVHDDLGDRCFASGHGGATTVQLINRLTTDGLAGNYKYAYINIGLNDSIAPGVTVSTFMADLQSIIDFVVSKDAEPILCTIPIRTDTDNTTFVTDANAQIIALGYKYVDLYSIITADYRLSDGVHPTENGNKLIYTTLRGILPECFY